MYLIEDTLLVSALYFSRKGNPRLWFTIAFNL